MKMKPPASSNSPTSRKKPRIMRHLMSVSPKTQSGISGAAEEIQPHQHLIAFYGGTPRLLTGPEAVDGAKPALYKGANGGGRNLAAAVLWVAPSCEQLCSPSGIPGTPEKHTVSITRLNGRRAQARPPSDRSPPKDS